MNELKERIRQTWNAITANGCREMDYERFEQAAMELLQQQAQPEVSEAFELLRDLADLQNGPPLERHRKEWEETMELVYAALNKWEAK